MTDAPTPGADDGWALDWPATGLALGPPGPGAILGRRPATAADADLLLRWFVDAHPDLAAVPLDAEAVHRLLVQQFEARAHHHRSAFPTAEHWVLELDGDPVGHLVVEAGDEQVHVVEIEVAADRRGRGIGAAALGAVVAAARRRRLPTHLTVSAASPARRLYERLGFVASAAGVDPAGDLAMAAPVTDLATVTAADFEPLVGQCFRRPLDDGSAIELTLAAVGRRRAAPGWREPFSLLFTGPADPTLLPDVHPIDHPVLGYLELFIGPVVAGPPNPDVTTYEVVFA